MTKAGNGFWQGLWRLADPKISLASFAGLFLAACFAARDTGIHTGWLAATWLGVFLVEVGKNASGEVIDFDSGTDLAITEAERSPFSGGKRVLVDGLLDRRQTWLIATICFLSAIVIGLAIVFLRDLRIMAFGLVGMALAWYYHGGSVRLAYRGLGELAVALAYGPIIVLGTYLVQTGAINVILVQLASILGVLVAAFLWINQFPDRRADKIAGKHNLVVRLGPGRAAVVYTGILLGAYAWLGLLVATKSGGAWLLPGFLGALPAAFSAWQLMGHHDDVSKLVPAQAAALASFLLMSVGCGLGYLLGS